MSHIRQMKGQFKNIKHLMNAAEKCGLERIDKNTYQWYGSWIGDHVTPEGWTPQEFKNQAGKCDFALKVRGERDAYEIGVVQRNGKYELLYDDWGNQGQLLIDKIGYGGKELTEEYNIAHSTALARKEGLRVKRSTNAQGKKTLVLED